MSQPALEASDLHKSYPGGRGAEPVHALVGLSFQVARGDVVALLGPNGAGKSTTVRILATLARPDSGSARVMGVDVGADPAEVRRRIGLVSQKAGSDPMATGRENLVLVGRIHGLSKAEAQDRAASLLARFDLADAADRVVRTWSGGMTRRLDVALGLVHAPDVLFLDEPTTGLDPEVRADMWAEIEALADADTTVLLTTHYLEEADRLADQVALVDHGRVVVSGTPEELKDGLRGDLLRVLLATPDQAEAARRRLAEAPDLRDVATDGAALRARAEEGARVLPWVLSTLHSEGLDVRAAAVARPSLDDVYLQHVGRGLAATEVAR